VDTFRITADEVIDPFKTSDSVRVIIFLLVYGQGRSISGVHDEINLKYDG
jgi:hypothetical protein